MIGLLRLFNPARFLWGAACVATAAGLWFMLNREKIREYIDERDKRDRYRAAVKDLEMQQANLLGELAGLQAGGFATEKAIRERFMMALPGEKVLLIETPEVQVEAIAPALSSEKMEFAKPALPEP